jgi:hypothetical protein
MFKKGQAAMEFLMTYGWAILVVLAAIGALAYFGVLSPDNLLPERTSFQAPLANIDTAVITTDSVGDTITLGIAFANNVGYGITTAATATMSNVELDGTPYTCTATAGTSVPAAGTTIANNERFTYEWVCTTAAVPAASMNKRLKADLGFEYTNTYTGQTRTQSGAVNGKVSTAT